MKVIAHQKTFFNQKTNYHLFVNKSLSSYQIYIYMYKILEGQSLADIELTLN